MNIKRYIAAIFIAPLSMILAFSLFAPVAAQQVGGGGGTIDTLDQWKSDGTNITQRTASKPIKITGLSTGLCLTLTGAGVLTTTSCGSGGGGSGTFSTTSLLSIFGATFPIQLSTTSNSAIYSSAFSTTTNTGLPANRFIYTGPTGILLTVASSGLALPNTALQNSSLTVNGVSISLGGSQTINAASSTLLGDRNTWNALQAFAAASTTNLTASNFWIIGQSAGCAQFDANGKLTSTGINCGTGGGSGFDFTATGYGASTSTIIGFTSGLMSMASSTFVATSTHTAIVVVPNGSVSASVSTGGAFNLTNTANDGAGMVIFTNHGASATGRLASFDCNSALFDQNCVNIQSAGTQSVLNISGGSPGLGIVKIAGLSGAQSTNSSAALSIDSSVNSYQGQGIFAKCNSGTTTPCFVLRDSSSNLMLSVDGNKVTTMILSSTTNATITGSTWLTTGGLASALLSTDSNGKVTATTTLGSTQYLSSSGVTANSYTNANITVNAQGIVTSASNGSAGAASTTLLSDNNTFSGRNIFGTASTTDLTASHSLYGPITNALVAAGADNKFYGISTTSMNASITGNAGTATALAANGTNCTAGFMSLGVDASGNAESCTYVFATTTPWNANALLVVGSNGQGYTVSTSSPGLFAGTQTNGFVLSLVNGVPTWAATSSTAAAGGSSAWPFTIGTYAGQLAQSTTTLLLLTAQPLSLAASSTFATYASSTVETVSTKAFFPNSSVWTPTGVGINDLTPDFTQEIVGTNGFGYFGISNTGEGDIFKVDAAGRTSVGTTSPLLNAMITSGSSTAPQLALVDNSPTDFAWTMRSISNNLFFATSTGSATSTVASLMFNGRTGAIISNAGATSTFTSGLQATSFAMTGPATSTSANGIDLASGCFSISGSCLQQIISSASAYKAAVTYASTTTLPANVYNNGTNGVGATLTGVGNGPFYIDGNSPGLSTRILVKNEATGANNGIYTLTTVGVAGVTPYVLTRATDYNTNVDVFPGVASFVNSGTFNANTCWILTNVSAVTIGTTALTYDDACGAGSFSGTYPIMVSGTVISTAPTSTAYGTGTAGQVLMWSGVTNSPQWYASSSPAASVSGGSTGMLAAWSSQTTLTATSGPTFAFFFGTSTTATSTLLGALTIGTTTDGINIGDPALLTIDSQKSSSRRIFSMYGNESSFLEDNVENTNPLGAGCRTATKNGGTETSSFVSLCVNNTLFWNPQTYNVGGPNDSSLEMSSGDAYIDQMLSGQKLHILNGGVSTSTNEVMTFSGNNVGVGSTTPWAQFSIASSTFNGYTNTPLLVVATSSDSSGFLLGVYASTTFGQVFGNGEYAQVPSGASVKIGGNTFFGNPFFEPYTLSVNGPIDTQEWHSYDCPGGGFVTLGLISIDTPNVCGGWQFQQDSSGNIATAYNSTNALTDSFVIHSLNNIGTGSGVFVGADPVYRAASSTLELEAAVTNDDVFAVIGSSTRFVGFSSLLAGGTTFEVLPQAFCGFLSRASAMNWQVVCTTGSATTTIDTGLSTSTALTLGGSFLYRMYVDMDANQARFFIQTPTTTMKFIGNIGGTSYPGTISVSPAIYIFRIGGGGATEGLIVNYMRFWVKKKLWEFNLS